MIKWRYVALAFLVSRIILPPDVSYAGGKIAIDDTKWISLGLGGRFSFSATEDSAPNGSDWSKDFNVDNARIYINGQAHKYFKFELNTECIFCQNSNLAEFHLLDAIGKIEINPYLNIWGGRLLVPADRREMDGPFYAATYDAFKTPFHSSDFSVDFGVGGAGVYGRDNGVNIWGAAGPEGAFQYVFGVFQGLQSSSSSGPNQNDNPLIGARVAYNFLSPEQNPGYYTSGEYFGTAGNVFTLAGHMQWQEQGAGSKAHKGHMLAVGSDALLELPFEDVGVFDLDAEYKYFDASYSQLAFDDPDNFGMFDGDAFSVTALYLIDQEVGIGKFQPYLRYTGVYPSHSSDRDEFEAGINYVIDGFNARISLMYQYGDLATKGLNYAPGASGDEVSAVKLGVQIQI
jgi:hypothetical protein